MKLIINYFFDFTCPWCFVGLTRLNHAIAQRPWLDIDIMPCLFLLNPDMPFAGMARQDYLVKKFGSITLAEKVYTHLHAEAGADNLPLALDKITHMPATGALHILVKAMALNISPKAAMALSYDIMKAFFQKGARIDLPQVIEGIITDLEATPDYKGQSLLGAKLTGEAIGDENAKLALFDYHSLASQPHVRDALFADSQFVQAGGVKGIPYLTISKQPNDKQTPKEQDSEDQAIASINQRRLNMLSGAQKPEMITRLIDLTAAS